MVRRVINMLYREVRGLHQAAYVLAAFAFGSQLLALVRDRLLASQFGADLELDIYYAAFRIPDLLYVLFASTLSVYVLIPFVVSRINGDDTSKARALLSQVFSVFLGGYIILAAALICLLPFIQPILFPGFNDYSAEYITTTQILLLQPLFLGISSLYGVVTQLGHRFVLYAISPLIYNVGIIFGIAFLYPIFGISGLAYGVVLGALGHMLVQLPLVRSSALAFGFTKNIEWKDLAQVFKISIPRALTLAMHQLVLLVLVGIASIMTVGSVSVFQFAYNLQSVPLAIIGASYSIAAFPMLADLYAQQKLERFRFHIVTALRHIVFWSVPIIGLVIVLRAQMVRVVLGSGAFDWSDTRLTAAVLALLVISLFAQACNLLLVRAFYAAGDTKTPFMVTLSGSIFAVLLTFGFYSVYLHSGGFAYALQSLMRVDAVIGSEVMVVALAYSIAITFQSIALFTAAARSFGLETRPFFEHFVQALFAASVGASAAYLTINFVVEGLRAETFVGILIQGALGGTAGLIGVLLGYYAVRSPELEEVSRSFHSKIFKTDVVAPQEDVL